MVRLALATVIALTAVCFVSGTSWAGQTDSTSFRIQDYIPVKFTDFGWKLDGGARLEGNYADTISTARRSFGSSTFSINRELQVGSLNLGSNWLYQFETPATLFRSEIGADFTYDNQKDSRTNGRTNPIEYDRYLDEVTEKIGAVDLSFSGETRKFVYSNAFLSGKLDIAYVYNDERTTSVEGAEYLNHVPEGAIDSLVTTEERDRQRSLTKDMTLAGELLVGYGRSYEGRHASMALFMAEELSGKNLLIRNPDRNQMRELSDLIRRYRLQHSPDAREHRTAALSASSM